MKRKVYTLLVVASMTLLTGCGTVTIGLKVPTQEELIEAREDLEEAKQDLKEARKEIEEDANISVFEKKISLGAIDMAEKFGIGLADKYLNFKLKGED